MRYSVCPDDLASAADLTQSAGSALADAARLVVAAGRQAGEGLEDVPLLSAAVASWAHTESVAAAALGDAATVLATGLASASSVYAAAEDAVLAGLGAGG